MSDISDEDWAAFQRGFGSIGTTDVAPSTRDAAVSTDLARAALIQGAPAAAAQLVHLVSHANNERVQLDASKYLLDRVLGPAGQKLEGPKGPLMTMLEDMFQTAEAIANGSEDQ